MDLARGYSHPQLHNLSAVGSSVAVEPPASEHDQRPLAACTRTAERCKVEHFVANETKIAAVRISANGWDGSILHGLQVSSVNCSEVTAVSTVLYSADRCLSIFASFTIDH